MNCCVFNRGSRTDKPERDPFRKTYLKATVGSPTRLEREPGSTQFHSQQQGIAFPPQLGHLLEGVSQTNGSLVSMPTVLPKNHCQQSGSTTSQKKSCSEASRAQLGPTPEQVHCRCKKNGGGKANWRNEEKKEIIIFLKMIQTD